MEEDSNVRLFINRHRGNFNWVNDSDRGFLVGIQHLIMCYCWIHENQPIVTYEDLIQSHHISNIQKDVLFSGIMYLRKKSIKIYKDYDMSCVLDRFFKAFLSNSNNLNKAMLSSFSLYHGDKFILSLGNLLEKQTFDIKKFHA